MITEKTISLNGKDYTLAYDWDSQIKFEEATGLNVLNPQGTQSRIIHTMFWLRLYKHHPELTAAEVSALIPGNLNAISDVLHDIGDNQDGK